MRQVILRGNFKMAERRKNGRIKRQYQNRLFQVFKRRFRKRAGQLDLQHCGYGYGGVSMKVPEARQRLQWRLRSGISSTARGC